MSEIKQDAIFEIIGSLKRAGYTELKAADLFLDAVQELDDIENKEIEVPDYVLRLCKTVKH